MSHNPAKPAPLSASAIAQAVFAIEAALDLDAGVWVEGDVHWWPLYRIEIYLQLFKSHAGSGAGAPGSRWPVRWRQLLGPAWRLRPWSPAATAPASVWLVSDGLSWSRLGEAEVERFCTPIQAWCTELGLRSSLIDRASVALRQGQTADRWWAPEMQRLKIGAALLARLSPDPRHAELVRRVVEAASRASTELPALSPRRFDAMARAVSMMAKLIQRRMQTEPLRAVFLVGFYDVTGYAFTLAAARASVACVDVQHGVTGPHHLAYTPWPVLHQPGFGWHLLPTRFWSWSTADTALINHWGQHSQPARHAVCGGHPFLQAWTSGSMKLPADMQDQLNRLLLAAQDRPRVLVTLQPGLTHPEALAPLLQAWSLRPRVSWWLRLHPMALAEGPAIQALAQAHGLECFDIETATSLPLPALLAQAHVHATHSSSTVIEAQTVGLSSVVWSEYGAELAQAQVTEGAATQAKDGASLVAALLGAPRPQHLSGNDACSSPTRQDRHGADSDNCQTQGPMALRRLLEMNP